MTIGICAIVPTRNRCPVLQRTLESLTEQPIQPEEVYVVDASDNPSTHELCSVGIDGLRSRLIWCKAECVGAASQRNQGVTQSSLPLVWFFDDDIQFQPECVSRLCDALQNDPNLAGVNAMIVNQYYQSPGLISRAMFTAMHGRNEKNFAGKVIGPAVNLLPEDREDLPEVVPVEWLNTTCTMYRREALPYPPFDSAFTGYSLMEDLTLSLNVAKRGWKLANVRTARIFHDSQPGAHKADIAAVSEMELVNRHYVMTHVLGRSGVGDHVKLAAFELFQIASLVRQNPAALTRTLRGKVAGLREILQRNR